jgi:hypothetical protein
MFHWMFRCMSVVATLHQFIYNMYKKRRKQNLLYTNYKRVSIHFDHSALYFSFTLCLCKVTSCKQPLFEDLKEGIMCFNIASFLCLHICQAARITIFVKKGFPKLCLVSKKTCSKESEAASKSGHFFDKERFIT